MKGLLFILVLIQASQALIWLWIYCLLKQQNDFTEEDASVKASTEEVRKAKGRLPKQ